MISATTTMAMPQRAGWGKRGLPFWAFCHVSLPWDPLLCSCPPYPSDPFWENHNHIAPPLPRALC